MDKAKGLLRPALLATRFLQWSSAVIVMGITSYWIKKFTIGQHIKFEEVIVSLSNLVYRLEHFLI